MHVGNARYLSLTDFPDVIPVFPLKGALLLPAGQLPLNVFEPRYLAMFDRAMAGDRLIGMVQPALSGREEAGLCQVGCIGRITALAETGDGRYITTLSGVCRFRMVEETISDAPYRSFSIAPFITDLTSDEEELAVNRQALLGTFRAYLDANGMDVDWESIERAGNLSLVNCLSMMSPFGPAEKQALLEAPDLKTRAETLIAITEMVLARGSGESDSILQ